MKKPAVALLFVPVLAFAGSKIVRYSMGGDIRVSDAPHGAVLRTMGGDIRVKNANGTVTAKTMGGDISVDRLQGSLDAGTMGGNVEVEVLNAGNGRDIKISSMGGRIEVTLPKDFAADFQVELEHGQLGAADAEELADFLLDLAGEIAVLLDEQLGVLASLPETHVAVGEPRARLLDDLVLETDVEQLAGLGNAFAVANVELRLTERCGDLVLDDLHLHARADDFFAFLDLAGAADVEAHRRIELQRASAGGRLGVPEHHSNLLANLVDENETRF